MSGPTLGEIVARLDAGEAPGEREALAAAITAALHGPEPDGLLDAAQWSDHETDWLCALAGAFGDVAGMVPERWAWALHRGVEADRPCSASVHVPTGPAAVLCRSGRADTPARALLLALLRAHAAAAGLLAARHRRGAKGQRRGDGGRSNRRTRHPEWCKGNSMPHPCSGPVRRNPSGPAVGHRPRRRPDT